MVLPPETPTVVEHFIFSYGTLIKEVGYPNEFEYLSESHVMSALLTYRYWKAGYTIYAPNIHLAMHDTNEWDRV